MVKPKLFIGSSTVGLPTAELVKGMLEDVAEVVIWNDPQVFGLGAGTFQSLISAQEKFDFAVLIMTPDDAVIHEGQSKFKPRDNVMIEFGLFVGTLGEDRAFAMLPFHENIHIPTDLAGVTQAPLKPSPDKQQRYDVSEGCNKIAATIKAKGCRANIENELAILYRLINAFTFPHYDNVHVSVLKKANVGYRQPRETFDSVADVVNFLGDLLSYYVYPHLNPPQLETMRIYFAYYLGDGIADFSEGNPRACWDRDYEGGDFAGEFVIGLANPAHYTLEPNWRIGRAIKGYERYLPASICASAFETGKIQGTNDVRMLSQGVPNYKTPDELAVFSFPVDWRTEDGVGRIGVITVSSRIAGAIDDELTTLMVLLANVVGFLFSIYAVRCLGKMESEGLKSEETDRPPRGFSPSSSDAEKSRRFALQVSGLRRAIAAHFEQTMIAWQIHTVRDGQLHYAEENLCGGNLSPKT